VAQELGQVPPALHDAVAELFAETDPAALS
jgi:hypothetical protein